jgi:hypothetical protein
MSLTTLDETEPAGFMSVDKGAGEIRLTRKDSKDSIQVQHWLTGEHHFPAAGNVSPAVGQIALDDNLLRYGTGSSWVTGTFPSQGVTGGLGVVLTGTSYVTIISLTVQTPITNYSVWFSGTVKFKRTVSYITTGAMDFDVHALIPPDNGFTITGEQFKTSVSATGRMETAWVPCIWGYSYTSLSGVQFPVGTVLDLRARISFTPSQPADTTCELMTDCNMVLFGA